MKRFVRLGFFWDRLGIAFGNHDVDGMEKLF